MKRIVLILFLLSSTIISIAQRSVNTASIGGYLTDQNEVPLTKGLVSILHNNELLAMTLTNKNGYFEFDLLNKEACYTVIADYVNYYTSMKSHVVTKPNNLTIVRFTMNQNNTCNPQRVIYKECSIGSLKCIFHE